MKSRGYTLIEILIVIVIISIVASVATLTIHFNRNKQIEAFANQLTDLISLAENDAMLRDTVFGVAITPKAVQFFEWDEKNHAWQASTEKVFRDKNLLDEMQVALTIHQDTIPLDGKPHLIISPSGDLPAFTLALGNKNQAPLYEVIGEENGRVHAQ